MARPMPVLPLVASITVWPGFSAPRLFGRLDDAERQAVLHRAQRIEGLDLDEEVHVGRREPVDAHDRRVADSLQDAGVACHDGLPELIGPI